MHPYWACVTTHYNEEARAAHHVERGGFEFYHPQAWVPLRDGLRRETVFPGYLFVRIVDEWRSLCSMRGIKRVLVTADDPPMPARIADGEIEHLKTMEDADGIIVLPHRFKRGDQVEIVGGKWFFVGRQAMVKQNEPGGRVLVVMELLGKRVAKRFADVQLAPIDCPVGMAMVARGMDAAARVRLLRSAIGADRRTGRPTQPNVLDNATSFP